MRIITIILQLTICVGLVFPLGADLPSWSDERLQPASGKEGSAIQLCTEPGALVFTLDIPQFELLTLPGGETRILQESSSYEQRAGYPWLPLISYTAALPPGSEATTVEFVGQRELVPGEYVIEACPPSIPLCGSAETRVMLVSRFETNRDRVYSGTERLPRALGSLFSSPRRREFSLATAVVRPFFYDPVLKRLWVTSHVTVRINYAPMASRHAALTTRFLDGSSAGRAIPSCVKNVDQARSWYRPHERQRADPGIILLTLAELVPYLDSYVAWRESTGFSVRIVTKEEIESSSVLGIDLQQRIRNWLRANAVDYHYLFIVANHVDIPMRILTPFNQDPWNLPLFNPFPSDIYYGDLSKPDEESWDLDGDGNYGEMEYIGVGDPGLDEPDLEMELHVGRINTSSGEELSQILPTIWQFESTTDHVYKKTSVAASGIVFYYEGGSTLDGAYLSEYLQGVGVIDSSLAITLYESEGGNPSDYACDLPLTHGNLVSTLASTNAGVFVEFNHGWMDGFARSVWYDGNGDGDPQDWEIESNYVLTNGDCPDLNVSHPAVAFLISCLCGNPEADCIAQNLLRAGSVAVLAHTRVAHALRSIAADRDEPGDGGVDDLFYSDLCSYLQDRQPYDHVLGDAVDDSRAAYVAEHPGASSYCNAYGHALYGDPTLRHFGREGEIPASIQGGEAIAAQIALWVTSDNTVRFILPEAMSTRINVWDLAGRKQQTLYEELAPAGRHAIPWNARNLSSGAYIVILHGDRCARSVRAVVLR